MAARDDLPLADHALVEEFAEHLMLERHLAQTTVIAYRRDLTQLARFLSRGGRSLVGAGLHDLRRFLGQLSTLGYARASIARRVGAIHTFYRWATARGRVPRDPAALLGRPKVASRLPVVLRPGEAAALVEAPPAESDDELERAVGLRGRAEGPGRGWACRRSRTIAGCRRCPARRRARSRRP